MGDMDGDKATAACAVHKVTNNAKFEMRVYGLCKPTADCSSSFVWSFILRIYAQ